MAGVLSVFASNEPDRDWERIRPYHRHQFESYKARAAEGTEGSDPERYRVEPDRTHGLLAGMGQIMVDTPQRLAAAIAAHVGEAPAETVFVWLTPGGGPHELAMEHLYTLGTELAPLLAGTPAAVPG
jgi:hypothetical protein